MIQRWFFYKFYALSQVGCLRSINQYRVLMMVLVVGTCSFMKRCVLWLEDTASGLESTLYGYAMNRTDSENNLQWAENRNIKSHNLPTHQILFYTLTLTIFFNKTYFQCPLRNIHKQTMTTKQPPDFIDALEDELNFPKTRGERCCRFRESVLGVGLDIGSNAINLNTTMKLSWGKWCVSGVC